MYTAQVDAHANCIVCRGNEVRKGYTVIYAGTYDACLAVKANVAKYGV